MTKDTLKKGDNVSGNASQGRVEGNIVKKQTTQTLMRGHKVVASKSDPQFILKSAKTGENAAHKAGSLKKAKS